MYQVARVLLSFGRSYLLPNRGSFLWWLYWAAVILLVVTSNAYAHESCSLPELPQLTTQEFTEIITRSGGFLAVCWVVKMLGGILRRAS